MRSQNVTIRTNAAKCFLSSCIPKTMMAELDMTLGSILSPDTSGNDNHDIMTKISVNTSNT